METENIYNIRLLQYADHLTGIKNHHEKGLIEEVELITLEEGIRIHYTMKYHYYIFDELPIIFDDWYWDQETGNALYTGCDPEYGTVGAIADYFNMDQEELCFCFDLDGLQNIGHYGGVKLNPNSEAIDIAENIVAVVQKRKEKN